MDNDRMVELFFARDENAIREARQAYGGQMTAIALRVLGDSRDAEECVSDGLLRAWKAIPPQRPRDLGAFLAKIVRGLAIDRLRAREADKRGGGEYPLPLGELSECVGGADTAFEQRALTEAIGAYLRSLSPQARWIFVRRYFWLERVEDIARAGGFTQSKVKSTLSRTRKGLREHLKKEGIDL